MSGVRPSSGVQAETRPRSMRCKSRTPPGRRRDGITLEPRALPVLPSSRPAVLAGARSSTVRAIRPGRHDEVVPVEAANLVGPPTYRHPTPFGEERGMMALLLGDR